MSAVPLTTVTDASRLVGFALRAITPASEYEYGKLMERYLDEPELQSATKAVLMGMRLRFVGATQRSGLVIGAAQDSGFAIRLEDYRKRLGGASGSVDRGLHGLLHLAVAACCYPTPQRLSMAEPALVTPHIVQNWLTAVGGDPDEADVDLDDIQLESAYRRFWQLADVDASSDGRSVPTSKPGRILQVLELLRDQKMLRLLSDGSYQATERYQLQVRDLAGDARFSDLVDRATRRGANDTAGAGPHPDTDPGPDAPPGADPRAGERDDGGDL